VKRTIWLYGSRKISGAIFYTCQDNQILFKKIPFIRKCIFVVGQTTQNIDPLGGVHDKIPLVKKILF